MSSKDKPTKTHPAPAADIASQQADEPSKQPPAKTPDPGAATQPSPSPDVADFLAKVRTMPKQQTAGRGRLIFAMDATMSRQPTWDMALQLQADMFDVVKSVGGLDIQLIYFRGAGECRASKWVSDPDALARLMTSVNCRGGYTQIRKVLTHVRTETEARKVNAVVYVGDCMEEDIDDLCGRAGELALRGVPMFMFQEDYNRNAEIAFREIARLTSGAFCRFDAGSAQQLRELLSAVAVYAAGGRKALEALSTRTRGGAQLLLQQLK
jgi:hypothetical protein